MIGGRVDAHQRPVYARQRPVYACHRTVYAGHRRVNGRPRGVYATPANSVTVVRRAPSALGTNDCRPAGRAAVGVAAE
jgi:hypothetical protein